MRRDFLHLRLSYPIQNFCGKNEGLKTIFDQNCRPFGKKSTAHSLHGLAAPVLKLNIRQGCLPPPPKVAFVLALRVGYGLAKRGRNVPATRESYASIENMRPCVWVGDFLLVYTCTLQ